MTAIAPLVSANASDVQTMMVRLSTESPTGPALNAPARNGTSWARLMAPTWSEEWVVL